MLNGPYRWNDTGRDMPWYLGRALRAHVHVASDTTQWAALSALNRAVLARRIGKARARAIATQYCLTPDAR